MKSNSNPYQEQDLLRRITEGDQTAFSQLIVRYGPTVYTQLTIYIKDVMKAEEITQDIMMTIWKNRDRLPTIQNFPAYIFTITRNRIKKALMEKVVTMVELPDDGLSQLLSVSSSPIEHKELVALVQKGVAQLPPRRREIFQLSRFEHMSHDEIAGRLNISKNTIKEHIREALVFLRTYIWEANGDLLLLIILIRLLCP